MKMAEIVEVEMVSFYQRVILKIRHPDSKFKVGQTVEVKIKKPTRNLKQAEVLVALFKVMQGPFARIHIYSYDEFLFAMKSYVYEVKPAFYINQTDGVGEFSTSSLDETEFSHLIKWIEFEWMVSHLDLDISEWTSYNKKEE